MTKNALVAKKATLKNEPPPLPSVATLLFEAPLYTKYRLDDEAARILYGRVPEDFGDEYVVTKVDGYCPTCKKNTTYSIKPIDYPSIAIRCRDSSSG